MYAVAHRWRYSNISCKQGHSAGPLTNFTLASTSSNLNTSKSIQQPQHKQAHPATSTQAGASSNLNTSRRIQQPQHKQAHPATTTQAGASSNINTSRRIQQHQHMQAHPATSTQARASMLLFMSRFSTHLWCMCLGGSQAPRASLVAATLLFV
jgi:hypothetical protein